MLLSFFFSEQNGFICNFILYKFVVENYLRPGLTVYKQKFHFLNFFQINIFGVMFNGNLKNFSIFKINKNPAFINFHFSPNCAVHQFS